MKWNDGLHNTWSGQQLGTNPPTLSDNCQFIAQRGCPNWSKSILKSHLNKISILKMQWKIFSTYFRHIRTAPPHSFTNSQFPSIKTKSCLLICWFLLCQNNLIGKIICGNNNSRNIIVNHEIPFIIVLGSWLI